MNISTNKKILLLRILSFFVIVFGVMTIYSGGFALFGGVSGKEFAGKYVPFVLWFNFIAGFFYVICGVGVFFDKEWTLKLAKLILGSTGIVFILFGDFVISGGEYEIRTIEAMTFRSIFWIVVVKALRKLTLK